MTVKLADVGSYERQREKVDRNRYIFDNTSLVPPSISIIVTNHNYDRYLLPCLESIARQSYEDFDCVIVDDASTDRSIDIINRFIHSEAAKERFRLAQHHENRGQMGAFITGLANTNGTFVAFVDADDILLSDFLEIHLKAHINGSYAVAFTCSDQLQIDGDGEIIGGTDPKLFSHRGGYGADRTDGLPERISWDITPDQPMKMKQHPQSYVYLPAFSGFSSDWYWSTTSAMTYRRAALDLILSESCDQFRICADYYLVTFCQAIGGSLVIPTVHGCYRRHGGNAFSQNPIVGGEYAPRNNLPHPPYEKFNRSFVEHVVENFDRIVAVLGRRQTIFLIARFASNNFFLKLWWRTPWLGRRTLLKHRILWKVYAVYERTRRHIRSFLKLLKA